MKALFIASLLLLIFPFVSMAYFTDLPIGSVIKLNQVTLEFPAYTEQIDWDCNNWDDTFLTFAVESANVDRKVSGNLTVVGNATVSDRRFHDRGSLASAPWFIRRWLELRTERGNIISLACAFNHDWRGRLGNCNLTELLNGLSTFEISVEKPAPQPM